MSAPDLSAYDVVKKEAGDREPFPASLSLNKMYPGRSHIPWHCI